MKRRAKGPNTFSQTIKDLKPGAIYSMKMLTCDYTDLTHPTKKIINEANKFIGKVELEGVDLGAKRRRVLAMVRDPRYSRLKRDPPHDGRGVRPG